jgi:hypothetical protein
MPTTNQPTSHLALIAACRATCVAVRFSSFLLRGLLARGCGGHGVFCCCCKSFNFDNVHIRLDSICTLPRVRLVLDDSTDVATRRLCAPHRLRISSTCMYIRFISHQPAAQTVTGCAAFGTSTETKKLSTCLAGWFVQLDEIWADICIDVTDGKSIKSVSRVPIGQIGTFASN